MNHKTPVWVWGLVLAGAIALPLFLHARDMDFYVSMLSRMMIYGLAACSLNLILGYGGLVLSASSEPSSSNLLYSSEMKEISFRGSKATR